VQSIEASRQQIIMTAAEAERAFQKRQESDTETIRKLRAELERMNREHISQELARVTEIERLRKERTDLERMHKSEMERARTECVEIERVHKLHLEEILARELAAHKAALEQKSFERLEDAHLAASEHKRGSERMRSRLKQALDHMEKAIDRHVRALTVARHFYAWRSWSTISRCHKLRADFSRRHAMTKGEGRKLDARKVLRAWRARHLARRRVKTSLLRLVQRIDGRAQWRAITLWAKLARANSGLKQRIVQRMVIWQRRFQVRQVVEWRAATDELAELRCKGNKLWVRRRLSLLRSTLHAWRAVAKGLRAILAFIRRRDRKHRSVLCAKMWTLWAHACTVQIRLRAASSTLRRRVWAAALARYVHSWRRFAVLRIRIVYVCTNIVDRRVRELRKFAYTSWYAAVHDRQRGLTRKVHVKASADRAYKMLSSKAFMYWMVHARETKQRKVIGTRFVYRRQLVQIRNVFVTWGKYSRRIYGESGC
jgi:hypothetical protein